MYWKDDKESQRLHSSLHMILNKYLLNDHHVLVINLGTGVQGNETCALPT
jgi:hypothetical protein